MYSSPRGHLGEEKEEVENQRETTGLPTALLLLNVSLNASAKTVFSFADSGDSSGLLWPREHA